MERLLLQLECAVVDEDLARASIPFSQLRLAGNVKGKETKSKRCQESRKYEKR